MEIDDKAVFAFMQETQKTLGEIRSDSRTTADFVRGVNAKINDHLDDENAHGIKSARVATERASTDWVKVIGLAVAVLALLVTAAVLFRGGQ